MATITMVVMMVMPRMVMVAKLLLTVVAQKTPGKLEIIQDVVTNSKRLV